MSLAANECIKRAVIPFVEMLRMHHFNFDLTMAYISFYNNFQIPFQETLLQAFNPFSTFISPTGVTVTSPIVITTEANRFTPSGFSQLSQKGQ